MKRASLNMNITFKDGGPKVKALPGDLLTEDANLGAVVQFYPRELPAAVRVTP